MGGEEAMKQFQSTAVNNLERTSAFDGNAE
jgi:hypothetical protein